jgi:hypothetical protein
MTNQDAFIMKCQYCQHKLNKRNLIESDYNSWYNCGKCKVEYCYSKGCKELEWCKFKHTHKDKVYEIYVEYKADVNFSAYLRVTLANQYDSDPIYLDDLSFLTPQNVAKRLPTLLVFS